jgi:hypothetical protein
VSTNGLASGMTARRTSFRVAHFLVRACCVINSLALWADRLYPPIGPRLANGAVGHLFVKWAEISVLLIPLFVGLETFWMRDFKIERRQLLIDAGFVVVWLVAFFAGLFYAFTHYVPF